MPSKFKDERETYLLSKGWVKWAETLYLKPSFMSERNTLMLPLIEAYNYEINSTSFKLP